MHFSSLLNRFKSLSVFSGVAGALLISSTEGFSATVTFAQYIANQTKPIFRPYHTMLPLTRWGTWIPNEKIDITTYSNLAGNWGYALELEIGDWSIDSTTAKGIINNTNGNTYKFIQLAKANPAKYKLYTNVDRCRDNGLVPFTPAQCPECFVHDASGQVITSSNVPVINPIMPDSSLAKCGDRIAWASKYLKQLGAPVSVVAHGGEIGACIPYTQYQTWHSDPKVVVDQGSEDWYKYYASKKWDRLLKGLYGKVGDYLADSGFFFYYSNGGNFDRNRYGVGTEANAGWAAYGFYYDYTKDATKFPSEESYWPQFNDGPVCDVLYSKYNLMTKHMAAVGVQIANGKPYSYDWLSAGWPGAGPCPTPLWNGYLKILYTTGMLGCDIGCYGENTSYPSSFDDANPAFFADQMINHGRIQALFSWVEPFTRNSDLLPGPRNHIYSGYPAYELTSTTDCGARVVARKIKPGKGSKGDNRWIISAWAMNGADRNVSIAVPTLGTVTLRARIAGSVYHAILNGTTPTLTMLDRDSMCVTFDTTTLHNELSDLFPPAPVQSVISQRLFGHTASMSKSVYDVEDAQGRVVAQNVKPEQQYKLKSGVYFIVQKNSSVPLVRKIANIE